MIIWLDGDFVELDSAFIAVTDRGFTLGDGIFDTLLIADGRPQYLDYHLARIKANARMLSLQTPEKLNDLPSIIEEVIERNQMRHGKVSCRTTISRGSGPRGLVIANEQKPVMMVQCSPFDMPQKKSHSLITAKSVRRNEHSVTSQIKSLCYLDSILAMEGARQAGADNAVMLNAAGNITCVSNGNIYLHIDGRWRTPPISDGVLGGTIRDVLLKKGVVTEQTLPSEALFDAKSIAVSNSLIGLTAIEKVDGKEVSTDHIPQLAFKNHLELDDKPAVA